MSNYFRVKNGLVVDETTGSAGNVTIADGDISTDGTMTITSTSDGANALYLHANAGTSETIKIHADQGTGTNSITVVSDAGGIDVDAVKGLTLTNASAANADDITIQQTGANDSSIHILAAGTGADAVNIDATAGSMLIGASLADAKTLKIGPASATQMVFAPASADVADEKITITNTAGTANDAVKIAAAAGGITLDAESDIALDANGGDVFVKDNGTVYGSLTNNSSKLDIYSGTTAVLKMGTNSVNANASFMGDLTVGGTTQTGGAANRLQVNSPGASGDTIEARLYTSVESPSTVSGVGNVLVLDNGNNQFQGAQGIVTTIGSSSNTNNSTNTWYWGTMDQYERWTLGYADQKHWDTSGFAGSSASVEKPAQSVFQVDSTGRILVGANNGANAGTAGPLNMVTIHIDDDDGQDGMIFIRQDSTTASGNLLGAIGFDSNDGNVPSLATEASAYIAAYATEDHAVGNKGGALVFGVTHLTDDDDTTSQEVMRVTSDSATSAFVQISNVDDSGGELRFMENSGNGTNYAGFKAPASVTGNSVYTLPAAFPSSNKVLQSTDAGVLSWEAAASGGTSLSNDGNNRITTADGSGGINGEANLTFDGDILTIGTTHTADDVVDINANSITTGTVMDISATGLTDGRVIKTASTSTVTDGGTSKAFDLAITNDGVGSQTAYGMAIDYNKSGITASGKTANVYGIMVDVDDSATNVGAATIYGGAFSAVAASAGGTVTTVGLYADASGGDNNYAAIFPSGNVGVGTNAPDHTLEVASSSANQPVLAITNTHAGATSGELRFNKNTASGADNDVMGKISFYGTDSSNNTHEQLAYIDAIITDSAHGSEASSIRFFVAENDATLTQGLVIAGQADNDGEVDVTIGAGAGSTTTIVGNLVVSGSTTQVNTTSITVEDALIELGMVDGSAPSSDTSIDLGMLVNYYSSSAAKKAGFYWDSSTTAWSLSEVVTESSQVLTPTAGATEMRFLYDAGNYYSIGVAANGATTLQTVDSDGTAGNLQVTADGTLTLESVGDITLDAGGGDVLFEDDGTSYGSISHTATGVMTLKSATDKELEIRSERDMTFVIDDDASDSNSFFTFKAEDNTLANSSNFDGRVGQVTTKYYSTSLLIGQTEFGKGVLSADAEGTLFTYDGTVFGAAEVVIHITDGTTDQVNKMLICSDTGGGNDVAYSNYSVIYSDGSTELGTVRATGSSGTISVHVDADEDDTVTYAVTFLA